MKTFGILLAWLLTLTGLAFATQKGTILMDAASAAGQRIDVGRTYAIYEYWPATTVQEQCIPGYRHVRLIVGEYKEIVGQGTDFDGQAWDMVKSGAPQWSGSNAPSGGLTMLREPTWNLNPEGTNRYVWAGPVQASPYVVAEKGEQILFLPSDGNLMS